MDDIIELLDDLLKSSTASSFFLHEADVAEESAQDFIRQLTESIEQLRKPEFAEEFVTTNIEIIKEEAKDIFASEVKLAAIESVEYAYPSFLDALLMVGNNKDLYEITPTFRGWKSTISVNLKMDEIAGTLSDYAKAVELAREEMEIKDGRSPQRASDIWRNKIWPTRGGRGPYSHTIFVRFVNFSSGLAPFWSLLDSGNKVVMESSIGGTPYPSVKGFHFVDNIRGALKNKFKELLATDKEFNDVLINLRENEISRVNRKLDELRDLVQLVNDNFEEAQRIAERFKTHIQADINPVKLKELLETIRAGGDIPSRPNIGIRGQRVRVSPNILRRLAFEE